MRKFLFFLVIFFFINIFSENNLAWSFSRSNPINTSNFLKYDKGSEFIKLSYKEFALLTGQKQNLWNKFSFAITKSKIKHDLKKYTDLRLHNFIGIQNSGFQKVLFWIIIGLLALIGLFLLIFGLAPR